MIHMLAQVANFFMLFLSNPSASFLAPWNFLAINEKLTCACEDKNRGIKSTHLAKHSNMREADFYVLVLSWVHFPPLGWTWVICHVGQKVKV